MTAAAPESSTILEKGAVWPRVLSTKAVFTVASLGSTVSILAVTFPTFFFSWTMAPAAGVEGAVGTEGFSGAV